MLRDLTAAERMLLGHVFHRVKQMIVEAAEDGECPITEMPTDHKISETLKELYENWHFDLAALEDCTFERLLAINSNQITDFQ